MTDLTYQIIVTVIAIVGGVGGLKWQLAKAKIHEIRDFFDTVDDALQDNAVTEDEYKQLHDKFGRIIKSDKVLTPKT